MAQRGNSGDSYLRRLVTRVTSLGRAARLRRQLGDVERRCNALAPAQRAQLAELVGRECDNVAASADHAAYGAQVLDGVTMDGLDVALERAKSGNVQVRIRGLALWLALVYDETLDAKAPEAAELHRALLRVMRELKVFSTRAGTAGSDA